MLKKQYKKINNQNLQFYPHQNYLLNKDIVGYFKIL